jgi:hypothetical protein
VVRRQQQAAAHLRTLLAQESSADGSHINPGSQVCGLSSRGPSANQAGVASTTARQPRACNGGCGGGEAAAGCSSTAEGQQRPEGGAWTGGARLGAKVDTWPVPNPVGALDDWRGVRHEFKIRL